MLEYSKYIIIFFLLPFLGCNNEMVLEDTWEGERIFIDAQLLVGDSLEIHVTRTFNPILSEPPEDINIENASVSLIVNNIDTMNCLWNSTSSSYTSPFIISPSNCYHLTIESEGEIITSKEVCIPDTQVTIEKDSIYAGDSDFYFAGNISVDNADAYIMRMNPYFSEALFRKSLTSSDFITDTPCLFAGRIDLDCMKNPAFNFSYATRFYMYDYNPDDYFAISIRYVSKELQDIWEDNSYKNGEFEVNGGFTSSFDNAYGFFGYIYQEEFIFPFEE